MFNEFSPEKSAGRELLQSYQRTLWITFAAGLLISFGGLHYLMVRPMQEQIKQLTLQVRSSEQRYDELAGARGQVWDTSNLLGSLRRQQAEVAEARIALSEMRKFQDEVQVQAKLLDESRETLLAVQQLQREVIELDSSVEQSRVVVAELHELGEEVAGLGRQLEESRITVAQWRELGEAVADLGTGLDESRGTLDSISQMQHQLGELQPALISWQNVTAQLKAQQQHLPTVQSVADQFDNLSRTLMESGDDLSAVQAIADDFTRLKRTVKQSSPLYFARSGAKKAPAPAAVKEAAPSGEPVIRRRGTRSEASLIRPVGNLQPALETEPLQPVPGLKQRAMNLLQRPLNLFAAQPPAAQLLPATASEEVPAMSDSLKTGLRTFARQTSQ